MLASLERQGQSVGGIRGFLGILKWDRPVTVESVETVGERSNSYIYIYSIVLPSAVVLVSRMRRASLLLEDKRA